MMNYWKFETSRFLMVFILFSILFDACYSSPRITQISKASALKNLFGPTSIESIDLAKSGYPMNKYPSDKRAVFRMGKRAVMRFGKRAMMRFGKRAVFRLG